ncbi:sensor histidine kinase [Candidatus Woesearchaeota archaeon]|nr:sensor histidine kinase [Candidatus Woesearchaeota archaeon]
MVELNAPDLVNSYLSYCNYKENSIKTNIMDLSWCKWFYPTTLLPLGVFIKENRNRFEYKPPHDYNVSNYIKLITGELKIDEISNKSYVPAIALPKDKKQSLTILESIFRLHNNGNEYGGENAFKYLVGELVDNIYEHSEFKNALVMAQKYQQKKFVEISFFDDGISIPASFEKNGLFFDDHEAIVRAINGLSTKSEERGRGLNSNFKIFTQLVHGEMFVVSRRGAIFMSKNTAVGQ